MEVVDVIPWTGFRGVLFFLCRPRERSLLGMYCIQTYPNHQYVENERTESKFRPCFLHEFRGSHQNWIHFGRKSRFTSDDFPAQINLLVPENVWILPSNFKIWKKTDQIWSTCETSKRMDSPWSVGLWGPTLQCRHYSQDALNVHQTRAHRVLKPSNSDVHWMSFRKNLKIIYSYQDGAP